MGRRLTSNSDITRGVSASDLKNQFFMQESEIIRFCDSFSRFGFDLRSLKAQIVVNKNLIIAEKLESVIECYNYLLNMKSSFPDFFSNWFC